MAEDFFGPLYGVDRVPVGDEELLFYWSTPWARDIANYVWDTTVPAVTDPWPALEPATIRDAMVMVLGSEDVTGHLFLPEELEAYAKRYDSYEYPPLCSNCGNDCRDKWCGLRGDDTTEVLEVPSG